MIENIIYKNELLTNPEILHNDLVLPTCYEMFSEMQDDYFLIRDIPDVFVVLENLQRIPFRVGLYKAFGITFDDIQKYSSMAHGMFHGHQEIISDGRLYPFPHKSFGTLTTKMENAVVQNFYRLKILGVDRLMYTALTKARLLGNNLVSSKRFVDLPTPLFSTTNTYVSQYIPWFEIPIEKSLHPQYKELEYTVSSLKGDKTIPAYINLDLCDRTSVSNYNGVTFFYDPYVDLRLLRIIDEAEKK